MKTYKVQIDDLNPCTHRDVNSVLGELRSTLGESDIESITINVEEMTEEEYKQLPEWEGY